MTHYSKKYKSSLKPLKNTIFNNIVFLGILLMILLSFQQCANMQTPTGGPKDSIPPKILNESPSNLTTNFKEKSIAITFDEYVKITNAAKEFSVSPDMEKQPIYKIKKKNLIIELPDSLEENTTYTINLGQGLVDFNESNPLVNYTYVFSTGPELDSLTVSGKVTNGWTKTFDKEKDKDINVILIPTSRDSIFGKKKAGIFTTVDTSGNFKFQNLRENTYRIYAIMEQNKNRIYDNPEEWIGFLQDSINLYKNISGIHLEISKGYPTQFKTIERKLESSGRAILGFNTPLEKPSIRILENEEIDSKKQVYFSNNNDSVKIYLPNLEFDSIKFELSDQTKVLDTILLRKPRNLKLERKIEPVLNINNQVDKIKHIRITSSTPLKNVDKNKIILNEDSISRRNFQLQQDSIDKELYHIRFNWRPKRKYELILQEGSLQGYFEEKNEEKKYDFTLDEKENYGDINITFKGLDTTKQYIVELLTENKDNIVHKQIIPKSHQVSYIKYETKKYTIRIIEDTNQNGRWDPANVWNRTKQENIWYLPRIITIRPNWEQNETIEVKFE